MSDFDLFNETTGGCGGCLDQQPVPGYPQACPPKKRACPPPAWTIRLEIDFPRCTLVHLVSLESQVESSILTQLQPPDFMERSGQRGLNRTVSAAGLSWLYPLDSPCVKSRTSELKAASTEV